MLIVFEGIDGCGKGTQVELLNYKTFKYPTVKTPELNEFLEGKTKLSQKEIFHLFLKDIKGEQDEVQKALNEGKTVILDRYVFSTIAYEKDGISFHEARQIVTQMNFIKPDLVILFDISPEEAQERKRKQKNLDIYESDLKYLAKVRSNFLKLQEERFLTSRWHRIDARMDINSIHAEVKKILKAPFV